MAFLTKSKGFNITKANTNTALTQTSKGTPVRLVNALNNNELSAFQ